MPPPSRAARHLLLVVPEDWYFWSHRRSLALAARAAGYRVTLATRYSVHRADIEALGIETADLGLRRDGRHPVEELRGLADLVRLYRTRRPDVVHHVAIKPVLYGSLAARLAGVGAVVNAISGLGYTFTGQDRQARWLRRLLHRPYRWALRRAGTVALFQNADDRALFVDLGLVAPGQTALIPGVGADLAAFAPVPEPPLGPGEAPVVVYAGRMLWSKGVGDIVAAVGRLRARGVGVRLRLVGDADPANPESIDPATLAAWEAAGAVERDGRRLDMPAVLAGAHVVVLASAREGVPKILLEAAAAGRPALATDVPGSRDVVVDGVTGCLVPYGDPGALANALEPLVCDPARRRRMGAAARARAETHFDERTAIAQTLALYDRVLASEGRTATPPPGS